MQYSITLSLFVSVVLTIQLCADDLPFDVRALNEQREFKIKQINAIHRNELIKLQTKYKKSGDLKTVNQIQKLIDEHASGASGITQSKLQIFSKNTQESIIGGKAHIQYQNGKLRVALSDNKGEWISLTTISDVAQESVIGGFYHIQYQNGKLRVAFGDDRGAWIDLAKMSDNLQESVIGGRAHIQYQNGKLRVVFGDDRGAWIEILEE